MLAMKDILSKFLNSLSQEIKANAISQGRTASHKTEKSMYVEADDNTGILYGDIAVNAWETGRKGGKGPKGFQSIILQWMKDKGIFQAEKEAKQKSIAFLIARKIQDSGTNLFRTGGNSGVLSKVITNDRISTFEKLIIQKYGQKVVEDFATTFKK